MERPAEALLRQYVSQYLEDNTAARLLADALDAIGLGFFPSIDHLTVRTLDVERRATPFLALGFTWDSVLGVLEFEDWWAKVYRKPGLPAIFIDQAYTDARGQRSVIPRWVNRFGDELLHHCAVRVDDIELAMTALRRHGVEFGGEVVGDRGTPLRQIFTRPEMRDGEPFTVLELAERHDGYEGFLPPQADGLMRSTRKA